MKKYDNHGFTTVELLVSLFIAALFLIAGHQLYAAVISNNGESQQRATAGSILSRSIDKYSASAAATCVSATIEDNKDISSETDGLVEPRLTVEFSCPNPSIANLTAVNVTVSYQYNGTRKVSSTRYVTPL